MKFGILFLPTYVPELDGSEAQAYQNMLEQVDRAEALGFESVWLTEHQHCRNLSVVPRPLRRNSEIAARANALGRINPRADIRLEKTYDQGVDEHRMLFGGVDDCVEHLRWVRDEIGVDYLGASFWFGGLSQDKALRSMDTFVREVVPRLEKLPAGAARG
jgi:alkanesulfonate monooxygenase SsuD/methylene tetrahydromethanopterin reductase-like flavin-dependent oxidoreductase (luciferase family)